MYIHFQLTARYNCLYFFTAGKLFCSQFYNVNGMREIPIKLFKICMLFFVKTFSGADVL